MSTKDKARYLTAWFKGICCLKKAPSETEILDKCTSDEIDFYYEMICEEYHEKEIFIRMETLH